MKLVLSGGGTGGHVNPALAIASAMEDYGEKKGEPVEVFYVGTSKGIENKLVPKKYPMYHVEIQGLRRSLSPANLKTLYLTVRSLGKAKKLLRSLRPDLVVGTGGYVCYPVARAAAALGIPCALHESNAVPGFAVRMLEKKADMIFVNFEKTKELLPGARCTVYAGTPVRREFLSPALSEARKTLDPAGKYRRIVVSFGGSLGAKRLNEEILALMEGYGREHPDVLFLHGCGSRYYKETEEKFRALGLSGYPNLQLREYLFDMATALAGADLAICRSGAMTLSELAELKKPAILIPSPNVTGDQQTKNARLLADAGAALLRTESELTEGRLCEDVAELLSSGARLRGMGEACGRFAVTDAGEKIAKRLFLLAGKETEQADKA